MMGEAEITQYLFPYWLQNLCNFLFLLPLCTSKKKIFPCNTKKLSSLGTNFSKPEGFGQ